MCYWCVRFRSLSSPAWHGRALSARLDARRAICLHDTRQDCQRRFVVSFSLRRLLMCWEELSRIDVSFLLREPIYKRKMKDKDELMNNYVLVYTGNRKAYNRMVPRFICTLWSALFFATPIIQITLLRSSTFARHSTTYKTLPKCSILSQHVPKVLVYRIDLHRSQQSGSTCC
jgi:hypothetical protein